MGKFSPVLEAQVQRLKEATQAKSNTDLAKVFDLSASSIISAKKRGKLPHKWFVKVATEYNTSLEWLISGDGEASPEEGLGKRVSHSACSRCEALEAKLDTANERLYEAMRENGDLKEENGRLKAELFVLKNRDPNADEQSPPSMASAS